MKALKIMLIGALAAMLFITLYFFDTVKILWADPVFIAGMVTSFLFWAGFSYLAWLYTKTESDRDNACIVISAVLALLFIGWVAGWSADYRSKQEQHIEYKYK